MTKPKDNTWPKNENNIMTIFYRCGEGNKYSTKE